MPADEHPRPRDQAPVDGLLHPPVGTSGVADRRVPLIEGLPDDVSELVGEQTRRYLALLPADLHVNGRHVDVGVNEAGHERAPGAVDGPVSGDALATREDVLDEAAF